MQAAMRTAVSSRAGARARGPAPAAAPPPRRRGGPAAAAPAEWTGRQFTLLSTGEAATAHLAKLLAEELRPGDSLCLKGDQGAGKSVFA
jgi:hypothetical protein